MLAELSRLSLLRLSCAARHGLFSNVVKWARSLAREPASSHCPFDLLYDAIRVLAGCKEVHLDLLEEDVNSGCFSLAKELCLSANVELRREATSFLFKLCLQPENVVTILRFDVMPYMFEVMRKECLQRDEADCDRSELSEQNIHLSLGIIFRSVTASPSFR